MNLPEPMNKQFSSLMDDILTGKLKIPQFQRDFVWNIKKSSSLLDSVVKGYPVGTFIFWKTKERLRFVKNIGNLTLPEPLSGDYVNFVLDGQQRITSLFAALKGETIKRKDGREEDFSKIFIDLEAKDDQDIVTSEIKGMDKQQIINLKTLLYGDLTTLTQYDPKYHKKIAEYKKRIESYNYSVIQVSDVHIDVATEIFTRINVGGKTLSLFEIMVAKTYDDTKDFDLSEKFDSLIEKLNDVNYETLSDATILQIISLILTKECKRKVILSLEKEKFIAIWDEVIDAIERTVDYFKTYYRIPVSSLLPYNALVVPFAYFFYHHKDKPIGDQQKYLEDFFWRVSLSGRYSSAVESKLAQDVKRVDKILKGELPDYDWGIGSSTDFIKRNGWFSAGSSYIKAILCIYAYQQPKSFIDNSHVTMSNDWLKQANSKNYHHFFPRAYLKKLNEDEHKINHILNITIVDDFLNKRKIKDSAPSKYMTEFQNLNSELSETMKTHLINDLDGFGVWTDNYQNFLDCRAELLSKEIEKRIIRQDIDKQSQPNLEEDYSKVEIE